MEAQEAKELKQSILWEAYKKELEEDIEKLKEQLVNCQVPEKIVRYQEKIQTLREVMGSRLESIADSGE